MAEEEFDSDLQDLLGDLEEDAGAEAGGGEDVAGADLADALGSSEAGDGEEGAEDLDLGDLGAEAEGGGEDLDLGDLGGGDEAAAAGEDIDLGGLGAEVGGGGEDLDLGDLGGGEESGAAGEPGGFEPSAAEQAPAPGRRPSRLEISSESAVNLEFLLDLKLNVTFEVGRAKMMCSDLLTLGQGSVIELHRLVGDELDLLVNGRLVAKGEVVVVNEKFGCKITSIISPEDRVKHLGGL